MLLKCLLTQKSKTCSLSTDLFKELLKIVCSIVRNSDISPYYATEVGRKSTTKEKASIDALSQQLWLYFLLTLCNKAPRIPPFLNLLQAGFVRVKVTGGCHIAKPRVHFHLHLKGSNSSIQHSGPLALPPELCTWLPEPTLSWISSCLSASFFSIFAASSSSQSYFIYI